MSQDDPQDPGKPKAPRKTMIGGVVPPTEPEPSRRSGVDDKTVMAKGTASGDGKGLARGTGGGRAPAKTIIQPAPAPGRKPAPGPAATSVLRKGSAPAPAADLSTPDQATVMEVDQRPLAQGSGIESKAKESAAGVSAAEPEPAQEIPVPGAGSLPSPGDRINHYEIIRELGAGGMGTVYIARDTKLGRKVAIKFLQTTHPELTQRFILEARATARCSHENIVVIHEVGEFRGSPFMVLEYLRGSPLNEMLEGDHKLPPARVVELMVPVVRALVVAHEQGIVHRDLKPDNIFLTDSGTVKVLDFGIAKVLQADSGSASSSKKSSGAIILPQDDDDVTGGNTNLTRSGTIMGTMKYMSPEQWGIGIEIDHRTDIWAMGILLWRMIAGQHPLHPLEGHQLLVTAMLDQPMPKMRESFPDVPAGLADVVDRCLLKDKEERFATASELLKALEAYLPGRFTRELRIDETPYAGLSSFQEADADRFFGRSAEIAAMVTRIRDQPMMAVVGSSGVGKSSFVRAGLVPALKQSGEPWKAVVIRPGRYPLSALAGVLNQLLGTSTTVQDEISQQEELVRRLYKEPGYLGQALRSHARQKGQKILLFVDQFEELYTLISDVRERNAFTTCLSAVADDATSPLRVVLSMRSDFLDRVPEDPHFMAEIAHGLFFLTLPNRDNLRDALVQPAEMAGFSFESSDIVEQMLDHLETTPGALPLLQFAASKLWETRDTKRKLLTKHSYQELGGIAGALASHANSVVGDLAPQTQALARTLFLRLITPERTRAIISIRELRELTHDPGEVQTLIDHLVQARLLVVQTSDDPSVGSSVEIVHESLIHSWPMLRKWLDENQDDAVFLDQLRTAANQWRAKGRDAGLLWRGETMEEARLWFRRFRGELPKLDREFLDAVFSLAARGRRRRRMAVVATIVFLLGLVAAAAVALVVIRDSQQEAKRQAIAATKSEKAAKESQEAATEAQKMAEDRLAAVLAAEKARKEAEAETKVVKVEIGETKEELKQKNEELLVALGEAEDSNKRALAAQAEAEANANLARQAQKEAEQAKKRAEVLAAQEKARADRLQDQLGSGIIEELP